jgi:hypothetical protein
MPLGRIDKRKRPDIILIRGSYAMQFIFKSKIHDSRNCGATVYHITRRTIDSTTYSITSRYAVPGDIYAPRR